MGQRSGQPADSGTLLEHVSRGREPSRPRASPASSGPRRSCAAREMGRDHGVLGLDGRGLDHLDSNIKLIWSVASNVLANQHGNLNWTTEILRDESLVEFIAVQDNFLTPTARFADLVSARLHAVRDLGSGRRLEIRAGGDPVAPARPAPGRIEERLPDRRRSGRAVWASPRPYTEGRDERAVDLLDPRSLPRAVVPGPPGARRDAGGECRRLQHPGPVGEPVVAFGRLPLGPRAPTR